MTRLALAALLLASTVTAGAAEPSPKPAAAQASSAANDKAAALKDAATSLMGPCTPAQATGKVKAVQVIDGATYNAIVDREKLKASKAHPSTRFLAVTYVDGKAQGKDYRQITTSYGLTTKQAQALVGQKVCVFARK